MSCEESGNIYKKAEEYWAEVTPNVDGMLGGFPQLSQLDIPESTELVKTLITKHNMGKVQALDCGAGIGRVSRHLLLPIFNQVDLIDVTESFINASKDYLGPLDKKVGEKYVCGLQNFTPQDNYYDLIWIQWCAGHLTDEHFIKFLQRCRNGLQANGFIVLKENIAQTEEPDFDIEDHSWTRPRSILLNLFEKAGLNLIVEKKQSKWHKGMYEVRAFALR